MNREAQGFVLFLVGGALLRAGLTDLHLRYVKAGLRPLLLVAGAVLIVAAIATLWYEYRGRRSDRADRAADHGHREPRVAWLLLLPLFALILVTPPALGSYSAARVGTALQPPPGFLELPKGDPVRLTVADYAARAVYDQGRSIAGRRVQVTGFIQIGRGGVPYLTRMSVACCAADGQPIKIALSGQLPPILQPDVWFEITGGYTPRQIKDEVNGGPIPFLEVIQARRVDVPREPYES